MQGLPEHEIVELVSGSGEWEVSLVNDMNNTVRNAPIMAWARVKCALEGERIVPMVLMDQRAPTLLPLLLDSERQFLGKYLVEEFRERRK